MMPFTVTEQDGGEKTGGGRQGLTSHYHSSQKQVVFQCFEALTDSLKPGYFYFTGHVMFEACF